MTHPDACDYYNVRGIAAKAGAWSDRRNSLKPQLQAMLCMYVTTISCVGWESMRGMANGWADLLDEQPLLKWHFDAHPFHPPLSGRHCGHAMVLGLATLAPHRNTDAFRYDRARKMHSPSHSRSPQKSLRPPHERFRPDAPMLLEHACIPRILKPTKDVHLCWGQALAEANEAIQDFPSALLRSPRVRTA